MKQTFGLQHEPQLIGRQIAVPSGRLDMLYTYQNDLMLIELKVATFQKKYVNQVLSYKGDLIESQKRGNLMNGKIIPFLLMPYAKPNHKEEIEAHGVLLQEYDPEQILNYFYSKTFKPITFFTQTKPIDIGIWNIHLINKIIYHIKDINSIGKLLAVVGGSPKTLYNKIRFSSELGLVNWSKNGDYIDLTNLGKEYVNAKDVLMHDTLSEKQAMLIKTYVMKNPYASCVNLGIASIVECVFSLSKTFYPVPVERIEKYFCIYSGKDLDWQTDRAKMYGARMYSNYAIELGLLGRNETSYYITPEGFKFVIQMQLQKSLKMMDFLGS